MARRSSKIRVLLAIVAALTLSVGTSQAQRPEPAYFYPTTIEQLNSIIQGEAQRNTNGSMDPYWIYLANDDFVTYTHSVTGGLNGPFIDVFQDTILSTSGANYTLTINKTGAGVWRWGEEYKVIPEEDEITYDHYAFAGKNNNFNVQAGTLEFMHGTTLTLDGGNDSLGLNFSANTRLNARGNNVINAPVNLRSHTTVIGLDLSNYIEPENPNNPETPRIPILTINGNVTSAATPENMGEIAILGFTNQLTAVDLPLLQYNYAGEKPDEGNVPPNYPPAPIRIIGHSSGNPLHEPNYELTVRGEAWQDVVNASGRLTGTIAQNYPNSETGGTVLIYIDDFTSTVGRVQLKGVTGQSEIVWNATDNHWVGLASNEPAYAGIANLTGYDTFLHGDAVVFGASDASTIVVQSGGVQIGALLPTGSTTPIPGMTVSSGIYTFKNEKDSDTIGIDGPGSVLITSDTTVATKTQVTFQSPNSYWGGTLVDNESTLILMHNSAAGTGAIGLGNDATLIFRTQPGVPNGIDAFFNVIRGQSGTEIIKENTNTMSLLGDVEGYSDTTVKEGTLQFNIGQGVLTVYEGATYNTTFAGAPLPEDPKTRHDRTIAGLSDGPLSDIIKTNGGTVNMSNAVLLINVGKDLATGDPLEYEFSGLITGTTPPPDPTFGRDAPPGTRYTIEKYGEGIQIFSNVDNSYSGGTLVADGTLVGKQILTADVDFFNPFGRIGAGYAQTGTEIVISGEEAVLEFNLLREDGDLNPLLYFATVDDNISGVGIVKKTGTEILHLTSAESDYTGKTLVQNGYLRVGHREATGMTSVIDLTPDPDDLGIQTGIQFDDTGNTDTRVNLGTTVKNPFDRIITGPGTLEVLGNTTVFISGKNSDELAPDVVVPESSNYTGVTTVRTNANLHIINPEGTGLTERVVLETPTSNLHLDFLSVQDEKYREIDQVYDRFITGAGNIVKSEEGTAVLAYEPGFFPRPNDFTGTTTVNAGTLKLLYAQATGVADSDVNPNDRKVTINPLGILELAFDGDYEKGIQGQGILAKSGAGTTTTLTRNQTYSGGTYLYSGTLSISDNDPNSWGNLGTGGLTFLRDKDTPMDVRGGGILQNTQLVTAYEDGVTIHAGSAATFDTQADFTIQGTKGITHKTLEEHDPYYNPDDLESHLVKMGDAVLTIDVDANWTGTTWVQEGTLRHNIPTDTELTVDTGAFYVTGDAHRQVSAIYGGGTVTTSKNFDFIVNNAEEDIFGGQIGGDGNLVKTNKGTLILNGPNNYKGSTTIKNGTVIGNIAAGTDLTVEGRGTYESANRDRVVGSLQGSGRIDMQNSTLTIIQRDLDFKPIFSGTIDNGKYLVKQGEGSQTLQGLSYTFRDDVLVNAGRLNIGGSSSQLTQFNVGGDLIVADGAQLGVLQRSRINVGSNLNIQGDLIVHVGNSLITTKSATLGPISTIDIQGTSTDKEAVLLVKSETPITDNFFKITVAGQAPSTADFITVGVTKRNDDKELWVGQSLSWYAMADAHGNFDLKNPDSNYSFTVDIPLNTVTGTFKPAVWDGNSLYKTGPGTLILTAVNGYDGKTTIDQGTLKLADDRVLNPEGAPILAYNPNADPEDNRVILGDHGILELAYNSRDSRGDWTSGLELPITGTGQVVKTGSNVVSVLSGNHSYTGPTHVRAGDLLIGTDGSIVSPVRVYAGAGFGGDGTVNNTVTFDDNSRFFWRYGADSGDMLTVTGNVHIGENVLVKPYTNTPYVNLTENIIGWKILNYQSEMFGRFAGIAQESNPYYDFELDYSEAQYVKINGYRREAPRALSDVVANSLALAQTRMYRSAYQQITRERTAPTTRRASWVNFVGRGDKLDSTYFDRKFSLQSYGVQAGLSLLSNADRSFGLLFGREEGKLSNHSDKVENEDYYLGFYYGSTFADYYDVKAYIGGGWQKNDLLRTSNGNRYLADYNGNTFNMDVEVGRCFNTAGGWTLRPFAAADLEVSRIGGSTERSIDDKNSNEYRSYRRDELARFFVRGGFDAARNWDRFDLTAGTHLAWNFGDKRPSTKIIYPTENTQYVQNWVRGRGTDLGRFEWNLNVGMNIYLTQRRNAGFFLNFDGDIYLDRDGDPFGGTGRLGLWWAY